MAVSSRGKIFQKFLPFTMIGSKKNTMHEEVCIQNSNNLIWGKKVEMYENFLYLGSELG